MSHSTRVATPRAIASRVAASIVIAVGYVDLVRGGTVIAPIALVIGYVVLVPTVMLVD